MSETTKIDAVSALDLVSDCYEVLLSPSEAIQLVVRLQPIGMATPAVLLRMIQAINAAIPVADYGYGHPLTGRLSHQYRLGRDNGRLLAVDIYQGYFRNYEHFWHGIEAIKRLADEEHCRHVSLERDESSAEVRMIWGKGAL